MGIEVVSTASSGCNGYSDAEDEKDSALAEAGTDAIVTGVVVGAMGSSATGTVATAVGHVRSGWPRRYGSHPQCGGCCNRIWSL